MKQGDQGLLFPIMYLVIVGNTAIAICLIITNFVQNTGIMVAQLEVYEDVAELLANMAPDKVIALKASLARQERLEELLEKNTGVSGLTEAENKELDRMLMLNRVVSLAKIRAKRLLSDDQKNPG